MSRRLVHLVDVPAQPWRNGGGVTRELLTWPLQAGDAWTLRISVATIDRDGPFSAFPGVQRCFAVLDGAGVALTVGGTRHVLTPQDAPLTFDGGLAPGCELLAGSTRDLNVMSRGGRASMQAVVDRPAFTPGAGLSALYSVTPVVWHDDQGHTEHLPAHTLMWCDAVEAPLVTWHCNSADPAVAVQAYWLHHSQESLP